MKKSRITSLMAIVAATALSANVAIAHEGGGGTVGAGNLGSAGGHPVLDSSGKCVKTSSWSTETAVKECNPELFPEPVRPICQLVGKFQKGLTRIPGMKQLCNLFKRMTGEFQCIKRLHHPFARIPASFHR